MRSIDGW